MNDLQTLFTAIFGIYFATTVATSGRFHPFDSTAVVTRDWRAFVRLLLAFAFLNGLPLIYFIWVLRSLATQCDPITASISQAFGILFAGLGGFGFYRLFCALVMIRRPRSQDHFCFYAHPDDFASHEKQAIAEFRQPPPDAASQPAWAIATGGVVWLAVCIMLFRALS